MKRVILGKAVLMMFIASSVVSCTNNGERVENAKENLEETKREAAQDVAEAKEKLRKAREEYVRDANERIRTSDERIADMEAKAKDLKGETRENYNRAIARAKETNRELRAKLERNAEIADDKWEEFKRDFNNSMDKAGRDIEDFFQGK
ncbi:MAG: hypothetical protein J0G96_02420 [Flavobacteriia bacterium]|nr:hypothetical protein [Flavobacteriia bacterium]OJX37503.1 MAG: hypothetical protein BGO87_00645 [Flavobacteriia bacterium 40-80]